MKIKISVINEINDILNNNTFIEGMIGFCNCVVCGVITFSDYYFTKSENVMQFEYVIENKNPRIFDNIGYVLLCKDSNINIEIIKNRILKDCLSFVICILNSGEVKCYKINDCNSEINIQEEKVEILY